MCKENKFNLVLHSVRAIGAMAIKGRMGSAFWVKAPLS
jgi:hypothetical protein